MAIDPKLIDDLNSRRKKVILSGGQEKIDKRHEKGENDSPRPHGVPL